MNLYKKKGGREKEVEDLHYWRKHNALHRWFENLYRKKGGIEEFNCESVELTIEDLDMLQFDIETKALKPKEGFFFGSIDYDPSERMEDDLDAIKKARQAIADGFIVEYNSWW